MLLEKMERDDVLLCAEAAIGLLKRDYIGIDLAQYLEDSRRIAAAVEADPLVDIITGDLDHSVEQTPQGIPISLIQPVGFGGSDSGGRA